MAAQSLIQFWIGATSLLFMADGTYYAGGASMLDWPLHSGQWAIEGEMIEFTPDTIGGLTAAQRLLIPQGPFHCPYTLREDELTLSDCPYAGGYAPQLPRRGAR